jgi:hypothetical protein
LFDVQSLAIRTENNSAHPTADWTGQQLREAFPFAQLPRYLLRDRDAIFGDDFQNTCETWALAKSSLHRACLGSEPISSGRADPFVANASII